MPSSGTYVDVVDARFSRSYNGFLTVPALTVNYTTGALVPGDNIQTVLGLVPVGIGDVLDVNVTTSGFAADRLDVSATIGLQ